MALDERALRIAFLQARAGDASEQRRFLMSAADLLRAYFRNRMRGAPDDAEDLVQETLLALHTRRDSYDPNYPLTAWLYAIARYRHCDWLRRTKRRRSQISLEDIDAGETDPQFAACDARRDVAALLGRLPSKQSAILRLLKLEQHSVRDAAAATGYSASDIKVSVHRGMKSLRRLAMGEA